MLQSFVLLERDYMTRMVKHSGTEDLKTNQVIKVSRRRGRKGLVVIEDPVLHLGTFANLRVEARVEFLPLGESFALRQPPWQVPGICLLYKLHCLITI